MQSAEGAWLNPRLRSSATGTFLGVEAGQPASAVAAGQRFKSLKLCVEKNKTNCMIVSVCPNNSLQGTYFFVQTFFCSTCNWLAQIQAFSTLRSTFFLFYVSAARTSDASASSCSTMADDTDIGWARQPDWGAFVLQQVSTALRSRFCTASTRTRRSNCHHCRLGRRATVCTSARTHMIPSS